MSATQRREIGTLLLAVPGAVLANIAFSGTMTALKAFVVVFMLTIFALGLLCFRDDLPTKYRSRAWAKRRLAELGPELELDPPLLMADESDLEAFDLRPGAQNYGAVNRQAPSREDLRLQRKTERERAELTERLKRPTVRVWLRETLAQWKEHWL
jgi:hypothetical protein